jgi:hypothetical protein
MIYSVTGAGPRTGTSFVMRKLYEAGLPVYWTDYVQIPGAEFETNYQDLARLNNVIVKVWPNMLSKAQIERMIVLRRDRESQVESIRMQEEREIGYSHMDLPESLIDKSNWILEQVDIERREYRTEELDDQIGEIVMWLSEPFKESMQWA